MTRARALRLLVSAARKVAATHHENYQIRGRYERVLSERLLRLRRAIKDFDESDEKEKSESE